MLDLPLDHFPTSGARSPMRAEPRVLPVVAALLWMVCACTGLAGLSWYAKQPGRPATAPAQWPSTSRIEPASGRANLVMLLHPRCPCSRASVEELDRLMTRVRGLLSVHVLFFKPRESAEDWERTDLWRSAAAIPGVNIRPDEDGMEARRFQAATSGQVVLYDPHGRLLFSGGITPSRGHVGESDGRLAIVALLTTRAGRRNTSDVFGCSLFSRDDAA